MRIVDSATAQPLSGALVSLLDRTGVVIAEGLTSENGFRAFPAPPGRYRVRVRRIGYRPFESAIDDLSDSRMAVVRVESEPVVLSTIVISARTSCRSVESSASHALATVWGEATKALEASRLTLADLQGIGRAWTYNKTRGPSGARDSSDTTYFTVRDSRPFRARDADALAMHGYVDGDATHGWSYFGPDEAVLLSQSFARTHCFRLERDRGQPGMIGVSFEPVPGRERADVAGVAWLDESTNELKRIVFRFVNAGLISAYGGGGETHFTRLSSGAWLVSFWFLRVPLLVEVDGRAHRAGFQEDGGGVLHPH
ncbi:MAG: carboxypeptidase-like regulatory domain-containing protein [Gemmatimonadaceae bacterium]